MTVNVRARDGTLLVTDIYLKDSTRRPVLVLRGCDVRRKVVPNLPYIWPTNAAYDLVVQDIRGDCLGGAFSGDLLYSADRDDGHDLLDYIEKQPWSQGANGHIAMEGWSNQGILAYLAAPAAKAALRGIHTHYATGDLLNYGLFNGGVLHNEIQFPVDIPLPPLAPSWADYVGWPIWDGYLIDDGHAASAHVAGLHVGGWFDVFGQGTLDSFSRLQTAGGAGARGRQRVVIGPWFHGDGNTVGQLTFPSSTTADALLPAYYSAWQKGIFQNNWTDWDALPAARVYLMGPSPGSAWRNYDTWPPPAVEVPFYFTSRRALSGDHQRVGGQLAFTSDPSNPCPTLGGTNNLTSCTTGGTCGPWDQRPIEARSDVVVFTSAPFRAAGWTVGRIYADVWIATDLPDVDVFVRMTDVYPDGRSMLMAQGIQRARYRNGTCPELLVSNQPARIRVDLSSTALVAGVGHKLRVIVSASAAPLYSVNPQNGDEYTGLHLNRAGSIKVLVGGDHKSALVVPVPTGQNAPPDHRPNTEPCPPN
jgi:predicted acyl esterase